MITVLPAVRRLVPASALLGLAAVGVAVTVLALAGSALPVRDLVKLPAPGRVLLVASAAAVLLTVGLAPHRVGRSELLAGGLAAIGGVAVLVAVTDPIAVALLLVLLGFVCALRPGRRPLAVRARGPAFAALLLGVGWALVRAPGAAWVGRAAALALALSLAAAAGLVPYLPDVDKDEPASSSYVAWTGLFAPAVALTLPSRLLPALTVDQATIFGGTLVGLGLVNLGWGTIGAWRTSSDMDAWRYSFLADWGLVLVAIGLFQPEGFAAAYLALLSIVLVRLPLYLWARPALLGAEQAGGGSAGILVAVVLAGMAPFSGFPVRLLVLQAATHVAWPLAVPLLAGMALWIAHSLRLARTVRVPPGRGAVGLWLTIAISLLLGLVPGALRAAGGL